jgi:hypothetical protein
MTIRTHIHTRANASLAQRKMITTHGRLICMQQPISISLAFCFSLSELIFCRPNCKRERIFSPAACGMCCFFPVFARAEAARAIISRDGSGAARVFAQKVTHILMQEKPTLHYHCWQSAESSSAAANLFLISTLVSPVIERPVADLAQNFCTLAEKRVKLKISNLWTNEKFTFKMLFLPPCV